MTFRQFVFMVLGFVTAGWVSASAQPTPIFTVPMVPVYAEGASASEAQTKAQATGRRKAMDMLLRRLTAEEDWVYLPTLATGAPPKSSGDVPTIPDLSSLTDGAFVPVRSKRGVDISAADLEVMEEGFAIFEEKTSSTSYRAKITYRFKPATVRSALQRAGLPYSEAQARRALIVPVLETANGTYLWETKNPWARAWLARPLDAELTPMLLPVGDRQDIEALTTSDALGLSGAALSSLAQRYRVDQVIIAHGKLQQMDGEYRLLVRMIDGYLAGRNEANAAAADSGNRGRVLVEAFFRGPNDDFPELAQRAVETSVARYAKGWKAQTLVDHADVRSLRLTAWFSGLEEWGAIQRALEGTPLVTGLKVGVMNKENAVIDLRVIGDDTQLMLAMRQVSLTLWQSADGSWNIAKDSRAADLQLQLNDVALTRREMERNTLINEPAYREDPVPELPVDFGAPVELDAPVSLELPAVLEPEPPEGNEQ